MKTVQEYIRNADREKLIGEYLHAHPIEFQEIRNKDLTIKEVFEKYREELSRYIDHLCALSVVRKEPSEAGILYVFRNLYEASDDLDFGLLEAAELLEAEDLAKVNDYSYIFSKQEEIMGYYVADSELTQKHIYELMADVMYEASWLGFNNEHYEEEKQKLEEALKETEDPNRKTYSTDEVFEKYGLDSDRESSDEKELHDKFNKAWWNYKQHSQNKERGIIRKQLLSIKEQIQALDSLTGLIQNDCDPEKEKEERIKKKHE